MIGHEKQDAGKQRPYYGRDIVVSRDDRPREAGRGQAASVLWTADAVRTFFIDKNGRRSEAGGYLLTSPAPLLNGIARKAR